MLVKIYKMKMGLATLLEGVNNKKFKVKLKESFLYHLWVLIRVEVGKDIANSEVVCQSTCSSKNFSENGSIRAMLCEKLLASLLCYCW